MSDYLMDSDPEIEFIEKDSGMSSLGGSKDETPERKPVIEDLPDEEEEICKIVSTNNSENFEDEPDETVSERLWGLTEMFPEPVRKVCGALTEFSINSTKGIYRFTCSASWIFFTSSAILYAPVLFETERAQMEEMNRTQQRNVLLGPGSAMGASPGMPAMPPMPASR